MAKLYVIQDQVAEESGPIFEAKNDGIAQRNFSLMMVEHKNLDLSEYHLYCVGEIDHETNLIEPCLYKVNTTISMVDEIA